MYLYTYDVILVGLLRPEAVGNHETMSRANRSSQQRLRVSVCVVYRKMSDVCICMTEVCVQQRYNNVQRR